MLPREVPGRLEANRPKRTHPENFFDNTRREALHAHP